MYLSFGMESRTGRLDAVAFGGGRFLLAFLSIFLVHLERKTRMATESAEVLIQRWKQQTLAQDQAIGQLLQHIEALNRRVTQLEQQVRQLEQARPTGKP